MIVFLIISTIVMLLAYLVERTSVTTVCLRSGKIHRARRREINPYGFYVILVILVLFVGLRTSYNDTYAYLRGYEILATGLGACENIEWSLAGNPGFFISNIFIKSAISENGQVMLFFYALVTLSLFFLFYRRWSKKFWFTVYLFIASGMLLFTMAALKQSVSMAIGLCGVTCFLTNKKYWFVFCVLLGMLFHPFLLFYLTAFILSDRVWSKKVTLIVLGAVLCGFFIEYFLGFAYSVTEIIGAEYRKHNELVGDGVNIVRLLVYSVTPVLSWIYRAEINASRDKRLILFANFALVGWCFMFIGLFVGANLLGRMAVYFDPFAHLALTALLFLYIPRNDRQVVLLSCVIGYFFFLAFELYARGFVYQWVYSS